MATRPKHPTPARSPQTTARSRSPTDPERVIATGYAVPALIEADAALVGISEWSRGIPLMTDEDVTAYEGLEKVAGETAASTNYEAIANLKPDLIVLGVPQPALVDIDMDRLESIAPVVTLGPALPSAWRGFSQKQSDAANRLDRFDEAKTAYEAKAKELKDKYAEVLADLDFGHLGAYGDVSAGNFQREFPGSWGTNIASDIGVNFYGEVKESGPGSAAVSEYPSIEELPKSLGDADVITYSLETDGTVGESVKYVMDSPLWKNLPAVKDKQVFAFKFTEAATYTEAMKTLDEIDSALQPLLDQ
ncbi:ABC transporter substrate-binding protein [Aeromicrobium sp. UC242_57]|uniref:ABC transporter substrate-binding protein n=1 Tax=Aeromicrobium sp. UC242_57 TaxID=3374624 RepID=UPI0037B00A35